MPVRVHGAGHPSAERAAVDPGRRLHRQVLHRLRHGEQAARVRARRLAPLQHPRTLNLQYNINLLTTLNRVPPCIF